MAGWSISFFFFSSVIILQKGMSDTRAQIKDPEIVTNKMYGCNIDMKVTLSGSLICARAVEAVFRTVNPSILEVGPDGPPVVVRLFSSRWTD